MQLVRDGRHILRIVSHCEERVADETVGHVEIHLAVKVYASAGLGFGVEHCNPCGMRTGQWPGACILLNGGATAKSEILPWAAVACATQGDPIDGDERQIAGHEVGVDAEVTEDDQVLENRHPGRVPRGAC